MATKIQLEKNGDRLILTAPEHPQLAEKAAELGGKRKGGSWSFRDRDEDRVKKMARFLYGTDGNDRDLVTLRVDLGLYGEGTLGNEGEAWLAGRLIARRPAWDAPVELGEDVKLVSGEFAKWAGSTAHPALGTHFGTVIDLAGVPRSAADLAAERYPIAVAVVSKSGDTRVGLWSRTVRTRLNEGKAAAAAKSGSGSTKAGSTKPGASKPATVSSSSQSSRSSSTSTQRPPAAAAKPSAAKPSAAKPSAAKPSATKPAPEKASKKKSARTAVKATRPAKKAGKKKTTRPAAKATRPAKKTTSARRTAPARKTSKKQTGRATPSRGSKKATRTAKKTRSAARPKTSAPARRTAPARKTAKKKTSARRAAPARKAAKKRGTRRR